MVSLWKKLTPVVLGGVLELARKSSHGEGKSTQAEDGYLLIRVMVLLL